MLEVVREQITRVLENKPTTFETFRAKVDALTYGEISRIRENERKEKEGQGAHLKPIMFVLRYHPYKLYFKSLKVFFSLRNF